VVRSRPMVIARSAKLLLLFLLIFSSGLCSRVLFSVVCSQPVVGVFIIPRACGSFQPSGACSCAPRRLWYLLFHFRQCSAEKSTLMKNNPSHQ
jgi:hypothetical protein